MTDLGLYPRILGPGWEALHPAVQRAHLKRRELRGEGEFRVVRGRGRPAGFLARLLGLPEASERCPVRLRVSRLGEGELWQRTFGGKRLVSRQFPGPDGTLVERFPGFELRVRLEIEDGILRYHQASFGLRWGPFFLPWPGRFSPRVRGWEGPGAGEDRSRVAVTLTAPGAGLLVEYGGELRCEEE